MKGLPVHLAAVAEIDDQHDQPGVFDPAQYPPVADVGHARSRRVRPSALCPVRADHPPPCLQGRR